MKRFPSVKKSPEFRSIFDEGKCRANRLLVVHAKENGRTGNRIGIVASKKIGNSVVRHRMTRILREIFRLNEEKLRKGYDFAVIIRKDAVSQKYQDIENAYLKLMRQLEVTVSEQLSSE